MMLALLLAAAAAGVPAFPYDAADEAAARAWIAQEGHRFDPGTLSDADLQPIVDHLRGARVIGVGEATHGTHQDQAFKAELIKALVRSGAIEAVAIECSRVPGVAFDRYVTTGEGDPAAIIRSPSFFSIWRNDAFAGLLIWLRAWNQTAAHPIRIFGVDNQDAGVDAGYALEVLARHDATAAAGLRERLAPILAGPDGKVPFFYDFVSHSNAKQMQALIAAATALDAAFAKAGEETRREPDYAEAAYAARVARQGLIEFEIEYAAEDFSKVPAEYFSRRDRFMAENVVARIDGGTAALWAHNGHVTSTLEPKWVACGYGTLGTFLKASLGPGYRTVGFTWSHASIAAVSLTGGGALPGRTERKLVSIPEDNVRPGDFGHVFEPLPGDGRWIDMASRPHTAALDRWGARPLYWGQVGWGFDPAKFQADGKPDAAPDRGFDIIVWQRTMTPSRLWPNALEKR